jgi:hypothetical protein
LGQVTHKFFRRPFLLPRCGRGRSILQPQAFPRRSLLLEIGHESKAGFISALRTRSLPLPNGTVAPFWRCHFGPFARRHRHRLLQVVKEGTFPDYHGGSAAYFKEYFDGFTAEIQRADAVVLLGGVGGTYDLASLARQQARPIFPVPGTGGDAMKFYNTLREISPATGMASPTMSELDALNVRDHEPTRRRNFDRRISKPVGKLPASPG